MEPIVLPTFKVASSSMAKFFNMANVFATTATEWHDCCIHDRLINIVDYIVTSIIFSKNIGKFMSVFLTT